ncbi:MAG: hypothetical protein H6654_06285 [Ardenticatenaceae bacterium]|nr:hypothetical protein [Anaerolineales bacterium]MCB8942127.1 hypothetical protein [Ardenticatenaceae bacterium]MCB8973151.1 hypothetical protein [Ardenticatenaceae bacterium]
MEIEQQNEKFEWAIYVDATLAGLAILIPLPLVDVLFEWIFKRRMPQAIAKRNGRTLTPETVRQLNRGQFSCLGCLLWPLELVWLLLKRTYRTILYFLTVKEATDKLSYYWHRAYLLDKMMERGDLDNLESAALAAQALHQVLESITTSPLTQLAQEVIGNVRHILRSSWRWLRRRQEDEMMARTRSQMATAWRDLSVYFAQVGTQYEQQLDQLHIARLQASLVVAEAGSETAVPPAPPLADDH